MDIQSYLKQARYLDLRINMKLMQLTALRRQVLAADPDGGGGGAAALEDEIRRDIEEMAALKTRNIFTTFWDYKPAILKRRNAL